jgi:hypothetical protein
VAILTSYQKGRMSEDVTNFPREDSLYALKSWKDARFEHSHTSFYGAAHIREMIGYWLGVIRSQRERGIY